MERFVDVAETVIAPQSTWHELSVNQLLETKVQLQEKAWAFRKTPQILTVLNRSLSQIERLIAERLASL